MEGAGELVREEAATVKGSLASVTGVEKVMEEVSERDDVVLLPELGAISSGGGFCVETVSGLLATETSKSSRLSSRGTSCRMSSICRAGVVLGSGMNMTLGLFSNRTEQRDCMAALRLSMVFGEGSDGGGASVGEVLASRRGWWSDVVGGSAGGSESETGGSGGDSDSMLRGTVGRDGPMAWRGRGRSGGCEWYSMSSSSLSSSIASAN